ncbi:uncharacterized protein MONBRDRAFT_29206 [Monosiga brevicollis MX1]|uniref:Uncharacterized protein n=1 Tax=Monosiga brevicollis TaxID=81824 RepID=A9VAF3_MONBE|nr:uncharacterized protein MONBRDRAFT_29206 [Monosiga brevicollis MX1]EDQ85475.1 predicted protein [Monosiga brevicollis MX1]|eukprot:XP_001749666.1 hypothetical protein [Monosiga brevicollis MX1]
MPPPTLAPFPLSLSFPLSFFSATAVGEQHLQSTLQQERERNEWRIAAARDEARDAEREIAAAEREKLIASHHSELEVMTQNGVHQTSGLHSQHSIVLGHPILHDSLEARQQKSELHRLAVLKAKAVIWERAEQKVLVEAEKARTEAYARAKAQFDEEIERVKGETATAVAAAIVPYKATIEQLHADIKDLYAEIEVHKERLVHAKEEHESTRVDMEQLRDSFRKTLSLIPGYQSDNPWLL